MHSKNPHLEFTFSKNRTQPISSYVTERQTTQSFVGSHQYTNKNDNNQNNRILHPQFLSLINQHHKKEQEQKHLQQKNKNNTSRNSLSFFDNLCRCVEIEKDATQLNQKITDAPRVDLRHLITKNKQPQTIQSEKRSLTPINSLVNLLDQRK